MLPIQPWAWDDGNKKLAPVRIRASVGHTEKVGDGMSNLEVLIVEFMPVDALTTGSVTIGEITTLYAADILIFALKRPRIPFEIILPSITFSSK